LDPKPTLLPLAGLVASRSAIAGEACRGFKGYQTLGRHCKVQLVSTTNMHNRNANDLALLI
jgi:hypothetical protein